MDLSIVKDMKILLIMPLFFGYEKEIRDTLEENGAKVNLLFENMNEISFWYRLIYVYYPQKKEQLMDQYYKKAIDKMDYDIDTILVIRGDSVSENTMRMLRERFSKAFFSMYQWDSVANNENAKMIAKYFDKVQTFDMKDAVQYSWGYRPLFYIKRLCKNPYEKEIDFSYICSVHSKRVAIYNNLKVIAEKRNLNMFTYMFVAKLRYVLHKYIKKDEVFVGLDKSVVAHEPLDIEQTNAVYDKARVIVDYTHPLQNGLTMRTIESVGHRCKLVTNNKNIKDTSLFNNNIYVYDEDNFNIPDEFLNSEYEELAVEDMEYYSLEGWLLELISGV